VRNREPRARCWLLGLRPEKMLGESYRKKNPSARTQDQKSTHAHYREILLRHAVDKRKRTRQGGLATKLALEREKQRSTWIATLLPSIKGDRELELNKVRLEGGKLRKRDAQPSERFNGLREFPSKKREAHGGEQWGQGRHCGSSRVFCKKKAGDDRITGKAKGQ